MTEAKGKSDKCQKADAERERRRKKYKFALVKWMWQDDENSRVVFVERKDVLKYYHAGTYETLCDWEPEKVLKGMLKLLKEGENE